MVAANLLETPKQIRLLRMLGIDNGRFYRAYRLALRSSILLFDERKGIVRVLVPSQRLNFVRPVKYATHTDILALAKGMYKHTVSRVGRLPENQQYYIVEVNRTEMKCTCPDTIYNKNPLCVHKIAALIKIATALGEHVIEEIFGPVIREYAKLHKLWKCMRSRHKIRFAEKTSKEGVN